MTTDALNAQIRIQVLDLFSAPLKKLGLELKGIDGDLEKGEKKAKRFGAELATGLNQAAEAFGRIRDFTRGLLEKPIQEFASFEQQMSAVAAITGEVGTDAFGALTKQAEELGASTSYSAQEAAAAMTELARAGRGANEIMSITPTILSLARAAGSGLADTAEILGGAMSGLGLAASDSTRAANVLTATFTGSATSLESLGESLKVVAPLAKQAGTSIESVAAMIGVLGNAGIKGSEAGTGLRAVFSRLINPAGDAEKALAKVGFRGKVLRDLQTDIAKGDLAGAIAKIGEATNKLPDAKRLEAISQIFGQEAVSTASVLIDSTLDPEKFDALLKRINEAGNITAETARVMDDNLGGAMERASGAVSGVVTAFGKVLAPSAESLAGYLESASGALQEFIEKHPEATKTLGTVILAGAAIATLVTPILTFGAAMAGFAALWPTLAAGFGTLLAVLTGPVGIVIGLAALGTAIYAFRGEIMNWTRDFLGLNKKEIADGKTTKMDMQGRLVRDEGGMPFLNLQDQHPLILEARQAGMRTPQEIADYLDKRADKIPVMLRSVPGIAPRAPDGSPMTGSTHTGAGPLLNPELNGLADDGTEMAVREMSVHTGRELELQTELLKRIWDETKRANRGPAATSNTIVPR